MAVRERPVRRPVLLCVEALTKSTGLSARIRDAIYSSSARGDVEGARGIPHHAHEAIEEAGGVPQGVALVILEGATPF